MTLDHKIADLAMTLVGQAKQQNETEYRSLCESFPILLRTCGLLQTVTFLSAKAVKHPEFGMMHRHLTEQFRKINYLSENQVLDDLARTQDIGRYRAVTQLAMRIAFWHKRMAQALLSKKAAA